MLTRPKSIGRLAPSPTGAQHLGNARTFLLAWLHTRQAGGELLLRIEDLDSPRTKAWASTQIIEDLQWLGLDWDYGPEHPGPYPALVQSQRLVRYAEVLETLRKLEAVYPCTCSRKDIEQAASAPHELQVDGAIYPGTCSHHRVADAAELDRTNTKYCWRFRTPDTMMQWHDLLHEQLRMNPKITLGDFVIAKSDLRPAYQLAVVVDDHDAGVTDVVRGDDLIPSTFRQVCIYQLLEWEIPAMIHVPLVVGRDGLRLAKRHGDTRLDHFRQAGIQPETLVGYLAWTCGLVPDIHALTPRDLLDCNLWENLPMTTFRFPYDDAAAFFQSLQQTC